ncbi:hypothetical protein [Paraburkholderia aromaticivorans]|uniref:hypothetical protein n=1 Tax=Paraburkholderia aromaticivorans TaxID=2026199 RepID=UPI0038B92819
MAHDLIIRTSEKGWYSALARAYKEKTSLLVIDDANVGFDPKSDSLLDVARKGRLGVREITGACIALGMSVVGVGLVVAAILDPEPTSKLGLLIGGGIALTFTGGLTAVWILTDRKPPNVIAGPKGVEISWGSDMASPE